LQDRGLLVEHTRGPAKKAKLLPLRLSDEPKIASPATTVPDIEIELPSGLRARSYGAVDAAILERLINLLRR